MQNKQQATLRQATSPKPMMTKLFEAYIHHQASVSWSVSWWRHQMEPFFMLLALCVGNPPVIGGFPSQSQWCEALMFSLICAWINGWANNLNASDLRHHHLHYDITVMFTWLRTGHPQNHGVSHGPILIVWLSMGCTLLGVTVLPNYPDTNHIYLHCPICGPINDLLLSTGKKRS